jgi:hypothetical protein
VPGGKPTGEEWIERADSSIFKEERSMRKIVYIFILCLTLTGCQKKSEGDDYSGGNMQYDSFRGSSSSVVNRAQLEAFDACLRQFDFAKYKGRMVEVAVYAANDHVQEQIKTLLHVLFIKNGILTPVQGSQGGKPKSPKADYSLEINAICGGYHFYPGFVFYHYQSTARVVLLEKTTQGGTRSFDSNYQEISLFKPVFTDEFRTAVYLSFFLIIGILIFRLGVHKGRGRTSSGVAEDSRE